MILPVAMGTTYFINYFLVPRYFMNQRFGRFALFLVYTFLVSVWLETLVVLFLMLQFTYGDQPRMDSTANDFYFLIVGSYFIVLLATVIKLVKQWYQDQQKEQQKKHEKLEAELKLLKSQVQPHFLFNTLNNIYSLALKRSEDTSDVVLKLSEILSYLLYECEQPEVLLSKEVEMIENYISLEKIRYGDRLDLAFTKSGDLTGIKIAPHLLLPFIENSFKHGAGKLRNHAVIKIDLKITDESLTFNIENNKPMTALEPKSDRKGIGLENVKKRLELIYKDKYDLKIYHEQEIYSVNLIIHIKY